MTDTKKLEEIRRRDASSADTWYKVPALGACGRAFIDRRWLLTEIEKLQLALPPEPAARPKDQFRKVESNVPWRLIPCRLCGSPAELWQRWRRDDVWDSFGACTNLKDVDGEACLFHLPDSVFFYRERKSDAVRYWNLMMGARSARETPAPQAPIARINVERGMVKVVLLYAPGLPDGDHELYCEPEAVAPYLRAKTDPVLPQLCRIDRAARAFVGAFDGDAVKDYLEQECAAEWQELNEALFDGRPAEEPKVCPSVQANGVETSALHLPPDGTRDGDGTWRGGRWHPDRPDQHAQIGNDPSYRPLPRLEFNEHCGCCTRNKITVEVFARPAVETSGEEAYLLWFADVDVQSVHFSGAGARDAAYRALDQAKMSWTCRLYRCVEQTGYGPRGAVKASAEPREWHFDRYRNGKLKAQGVKVRAVTEAEAREKARSLLHIDGNLPTDELRLQVNGKAE